jgi:hypothetical protein
MPAKGTKGHAAGHYEVRDHPTLKGLVTIHWCPPAGPPDPMPVHLDGAMGVPALAKLRTAIDAYLNAHAIQAAEEAAAADPADELAKVRRLREAGG